MQGKTKYCRWIKKSIVDGLRTLIAMKVNYSLQRQYHVKKKQEQDECSKRIQKYVSKKKWVECPRIHPIFIEIKVSTNAYL